MKVRLFKSGSIVGEVQGSVGSDKRLERRAMLVYVGKFDSMDGEVEVTPEHIKKLAENHNADYTRLSAAGAIGPKDCPPVQVDHSTSGWDTVGRVAGPLEVGDFEGNTALFGTLTFLGSDAVERVSDGRWTHLSLGADLEAGKMNEMTVTPFPAAPNASLLSKSKGSVSGKQKYKGRQIGAYYDGEDDGKDEFRPWIDGKAFNVSWEQDYEAIKAAKDFIDDQDEGKKFSKLAKVIGSKTVGDYRIDIEKDSAKGNFYVRVNGSLDLITKDQGEAANRMNELIKKYQSAKFSKGDSMDPKHEKMRKHLMEKENLSEKDADEKLSKMDDEEKEKLSASLAEPPPVAEEKPSDKKMSKESKKKFTELTKSFREGAVKLTLENKKVQLAGRISKLRSEGKVTPAEQKEINLDKLAKLDQASLETVFEVMSQRSPNQVVLGAIGSSKAANMKDVAKAAKDKEMLKEMDESMRFSKGVLKNLSGMPTSMDDKGQQLEGEGGGMPTSMDTVAQLSHMKKLMDGGMHEEAMKHLEGMIAHHQAGAGKEDNSQAGLPDTSMKHLSALAESVEKLQTQFEELVNLASPLLTDEE